VSSPQGYFVPAEWLAAITGKKLFYPCAGPDVLEPTEIFAPIVSELWYGDIAYPAGLRMDCVLGQSPHQDYALKDVEIIGDAYARVERREGYRFLSPSKRIETYWRQDGSSVRVIRRRGFGQIALGAEFPDDTIGVFFFRGDGGGEGGSGVSFFQDRRRRHPPLQNLFSLLRRKLAKPALVVTDGSNNSRRSNLPISQFFNTAISSEEAFMLCRDKVWKAGNLRWRCVGFAGRRYGPTLVWAVEPV
jgi:hypothetical protein